MATNFVSGTTPQLGGNNLFTENSLGQWELGGITGPSIVRQIFTASGTYTPSPGMIVCEVEAYGAGGGGGGADSNASATVTAGGGGAGAYVRSLLTPADIGASQTVTIGAGGTGGAASPEADGTDGGDTSLGTLVVADGGEGGQRAEQWGLFGEGGAGGLVANCTGDYKAPGARGGTGGQGGSSSNDFAMSGFGASGSQGTGGFCHFSAAGGDATGYASGGGGAMGYNGNDYAGGDGSDGLIIITEYIRQNAHWPIATDVNGNEVIDLTGGTASAVNFVAINNAATGNAPSVLADGDDTNIDLALGGKGTGDIVPVSNDGAALGTTSLGWSDLFLADGGEVDFGNAGVQIEHDASEDSLVFRIDNANATANSRCRWIIDGTQRAVLGTTYFQPGSNDGQSLGLPANSWSDLYLAAGGVINWNNGDLKIFHNGSDTLIDEVGDGDFYFRATPSDGTGARLYVQNLKSTLADFNEVAALKFVGYDDASNAFNVYGTMKVICPDVSSTTEDGRYVFECLTAGSETEVLRFDGAGLSLNGGVDYLDDYEEGTWTPTFHAETTDFDSVGYLTQSGTYTKIGRFVFASFTLEVNSLTVGSAAGRLGINGLPYTVASAINGAGVPSYYTNFTTQGPEFIRGRSGQTDATLRYFNGTANGNLDYTNLSSTTDMQGTVCYYI